jgi:hypothetical protein
VCIYETLARTSTVIKYTTILIITGRPNIICNKSITFSIQCLLSNNKLIIIIHKKIESICSPLNYPNYPWRAAGHHATTYSCVKTFFFLANILNKKNKKLSTWTKMSLNLVNTDIGSIRRKLSDTLTGW